MRNNQNNIKAKSKFSLQHKLLLPFVVFSMIAVFFVSRELFIGFTQTKDKREKVIAKASFSFPNQPIEIVGAGNSRKFVKLNEKFTQDTDWLKDFKIKFKNKFNKNITFILFGIEFPETISSGNIMSFPLSYGFHPVFSAKDEKVDPVKADETFELTLTEKNYQQLKSFIEKRHLLDDLSKVEIRLGFILFEDGTGWSTGKLVRPDPNNPQTFVPIDSKD